jgi:ABC-2 type transport system permease protein
MDILKISTDWAKAEVFSSKMICLGSLLFFLVAICFWLFGKTAMARAFILPMTVSGILLLIASAGLYLSNKPRLTQFETASQTNPQLFIQSEINRTAKAQKDLAMIIFKIFPLIIIAAAILIILVPKPFWRSIGITIIILTATLMLIDSNTDARNTAYHQQLLSII